jgi:hypothetical protein
VTWRACPCSSQSTWQCTARQQHPHR